MIPLDEYLIYFIFEKAKTTNLLVKNCALKVLVENFR